MYRRIIILFLTLSLISICACAAQLQQAKPFASLEELHNAMKPVSEADDADSFWNRVLAHKKMPLIFGENVVFLWRGDAEAVDWRGDFNLWEPTPETQGKRIGNSNIWWFERLFPKDARLDYKIVLNGDDWQVDPLNPHQQVGGFGPNSEVRMPDWKLPQNIVPRSNIEHGTLTKDIAFDSAKLGYSINYRVYTPTGFNPASSKNLPVLYVTDGSDYWRDEMGGLVITMDNLIAEKKIAPILVVFIDPWDRRANVNRREQQLVPASDRSCAFCEFIVDELIPTIEKAYPAQKTREGRAILGTSLGGLHSTFMASRYGSLFGMIGVQSPAYGRTPWVLEEAGGATPLPIKAFIDAGRFEGDYVNFARMLRDTWGQKNVDVKYFELNEGHSWGHWRALLDDMLEFFYPPNGLNLQD